MSNKKQNIEEIKKKIAAVLKKHGIKKAGIFGSFVRGEAKKGSDIDILIQPPRDRKFSLLDLVGLQLELEERIGIKVDILTYKGIYHLLRDRILNEEMKII